MASPLRVAVTGPAGFLGWHVNRVAATAGVDCVPIGRHVWSDPAELDRIVATVDAVVHCAGATRGPETGLIDGNVPLARTLAAAVARAPSRPRVVYANTVQSRVDTVYGMAKRMAADILASTCPRFSDVVIANLYGPGDRPFHNSFIATFSHQLVRGVEPTVVDDKTVHLVHVDDAAAVLLDEAGQSGRRMVEPEGVPVVVSEVLATLRQLHDACERGVLVDVSCPLHARLLRAYRSHRRDGGR